VSTRTDELLYAISEGLTAVHAELRRIGDALGAPPVETPETPEPEEPTP
jgi:hypothetical protein